MTWDREKAQAMFTAGMAYRQIADELEVNESSVRRWFNRHVHRTPSPDLSPVVKSKILGAVRPLAARPNIPAKRTKSTTRAILYGDTHFVRGVEPSKTLDVLMAVAEDAKPDIIIDMGDTLDCYAVSQYDKDPKRLGGLQDEIDQARQWFAAIRPYAPEMVLLDSNHFDRLRRMLWKLPTEAQALAELTAFQQTMTWPSLLGLTGLDIQWVPQEQQPIFGILPNFLLLHGERVRSKAGLSAHGEMGRFNKSGASAHVHRLAYVCKTDYNGGIGWIETGHTGPESPEYCRHPDWQPGFVVVEFDNETGAFTPELVSTYNGKGVWRGRTYTA